MKTIRWFLSHFFLILLVVAVIYGYMFWGNLAGEKTPVGKALVYLSSEFVEVDEFIKAVKAKQAQLSGQQLAGDTQVETQPDVQAETPQSSETKTVGAPPENKPDEPPEAAAAEETNNAPVVARNITQQPVSISYSHNQMRVKQNSIGQIESQPETPSQTETAAVSIEPAAQTQAEPLANAVAEAEVEIEPAELALNTAPALPEAALEAPSRSTISPVKTTDNFVSAKVEQQLNNVDKNGKVINPVLKTYAIRDSWITARKSFYQRKYALSEQSYREVINNTNDNFDAYGELGNVYFNQGKNAEAAAAYFEAASILVRKGQISRARSLMGLLRHLDDSKAADLKKLIDSAAS